MNILGMMFSSEVIIPFIINLDGNEIQQDIQTDVQTLLMIDNRQTIICLACFGTNRILVGLSL